MLVFTVLFLLSAGFVFGSAGKEVPEAIKQIEKVDKESGRVYGFGIFFNVPEETSTLNGRKLRIDMIKLEPSTGDAYLNKAVPVTGAIKTIQLPPYYMFNLDIYYDNAGKREPFVVENSQEAITMYVYNGGMGLDVTKEPALYYWASDGHEKRWVAHTDVIDLQERKMYDFNMQVSSFSRLDKDSDVWIMEITKWPVDDRIIGIDEH